MLGSKLDIPDYIARTRDELAKVDQEATKRWADLIYKAWESGNTVFIVGNGGSATTASHMAEDLGKSTLPEHDLLDESRKRLRVLSLTDNVGWLLAVGNDLGYDQIFVQQLMNYGQAGDVLIAISGSGNSDNVVKAVDWANRHNLNTFGVTGFDGGLVRKNCTDGLWIDVDDMGMIESIHLTVFHWVLNDVFARINATGRYSA